MRAPDGADRAARARAILDAEGLPADVRSLGPDGEIAAVAAPTGSLDRLRQLAPRLRSLGYRYVALDVAAGEHRTGE